MPERMSGVNSESLLPDANIVNNNSNINNSANMPDVVISGSSEKDFDMDEEVMSIMHSRIHSKPSKSNRDDDNDDNEDDDDDDDDDENDNDDQGNNDQLDSSHTTQHRSHSNNNNINNNNINRTKISINSSWDAPLLSAKENSLAPDDYNEAMNGRISRHSECSIEADLHAEHENLLEEDDATEMAKRLEDELAGSILALWQQRLTQSSPHEDDIEIDYASESDIASTGPPSPTPESTGSVVPPPTQFADNSSVGRDRNGNSQQIRPVNPNAPIKLPIMGDNSSSSNVALNEIRARLRKTKFDYSADNRQRITDATPKTDYRGVLKKKGAA